ncbi:MAG TPA: DoxX family protein [Longimicrobiales bacterium]
MPDFVESRESTVADLGFTLLRVVVGLTFVAHGALKVFMMGHAGTAGFFAHLGVPFPGTTSVLIMALECLGGLALVFGLFTRVLAFLLACDMAGAILFAKLRGGFFAPNGAELEILLLACALAFALGGGGPWSLDALLDRRHHR